jgi:hypothetical protein
MMHVFVVSIQIYYACANELPEGSDKLLVDPDNAQDVGIKENTLIRYLFAGQQMQVFNKSIECYCACADGLPNGSDELLVVS